MDKKLYKVKKDAKVDGVCSGIAQYLGVDVTVVRLIFVVLAFCGGSAILLYIICAIVMPEEPGYIDCRTTEVKQQTQESNDQHTN